MGCWKERERRNERTNDSIVSNRRIFTRFWKWKCVKKIAACDPPVPLGDHGSSCQERTPVIAAGFQLEGNLCHFKKLHVNTQHRTPTTCRWGVKRAKLCPRSPWPVQAKFLLMPYRKQGD